MPWGSFTLIFFMATFKFMFAPFTGIKIGLNFLETFIVCAAGGIFSAAIFYYSAELLMIRAHNKKVERKQHALDNGYQWVDKQKFTRTNKFVVRIKRTLGMYGICFWAPFLLSVPIGSVITAKFYGKHKKTFPLIILGMFLNSFLMTLLAWLIL